MIEAKSEREAGMSGEERPMDQALGAGLVVEGVGINLLKLETALETVIDSSCQRRGFTLFTLNLDHLCKLRSDPTFRRVYSRATYVSADGWPVVWLARLQGATLERTSGADLVEPLCKAAASQGLSMYFIGPGKVSQEKALRLLEEKYTGLKIVGCEAPTLMVTTPSEVDRELHALGTISRITASNANICLVSLGAPKQELVADILSAYCTGVGFICVGAALDFISGEVRRAPVWMMRCNLEWAWRLATNPRRLAARYLECAFLFISLVPRVISGGRTARSHPL
jgi:N-acetylglucosaminyldiphosphoundecaprenol N-acetyl-beta-D-mannosaminyltransferase